MNKSHRLYIPITLAALALAGELWANTRPELDNNFRAWLSWAVLLLFGLLVTVWFLLLSRYTARTRLVGLGCLALVGLGLRSSLRLDGSLSGTGLPRYRWAWTAPTEKHFTQSEAELPGAPTVTASIDVPQFLGADRTGIFSGVRFGTDWQKTPPRELWRQDIGEGWGAFCVIGGRAVTQEQRGEEEWVSCYDLGNGKLLWHHADKTRFIEWQGGDGPRATPTHAEGKLYTFGATGVLNCLELASGKVLWTHDTLRENNAKNITWGISTSPLVHGGQVIVTGGDRPGPTLLSFDAATGALRWKSGTDSGSYVSPCIAKVAGKEYLVSNNATSLGLYDPSTGQVAFEFPWGSDKFPKASQPVMLPGDKVFLSAGYAMGCMMLQLKADSTGKLSATTLWQHNKMKTQFNSVTPSGQHLYGLDDGKLACIDSNTGERLWKEGRYGNGQHILLLGLGTDPVAMIQSETGPIYLLGATPAGAKEIAKLDALDTKTWNFPTLAGRHLLVRNDRKVACYELPK